MAPELDWLNRGKEFLRPYYLRWLYFRLFPDRKPKYFEDCWAFPALHTTIQPGEAEPDLLFLPMTDWHTRIQRTQHLARAFASGGQRCFYLNPHLGREFPAPYLFSPGSCLNSIERLITEVHVHLPLEPVFHHRMLTSHENARILDALRNVVTDGATTSLVQFVSFPLWLSVAEQLRHEFGFPVVYDCHDVLSGFRNISTSIIEAEQLLFEKSDLVVFSSQSLLSDNVKRYPALANKSILVRNAVDEAWLNQTPASGQTGTVVGYVGALDFWFDRKAIELAARRHPEWKFILVGRVEDESILQLRSLSNVEFTGEKPHSELHSFLSTFRVALIPFLRNELTIGTNPIKLYEYFSHGIPVVATRLPELDQFSSLAYLSGNTEEFVQQLEIAMQEDNAVFRQERIRIAHEETWTNRVTQLRQRFAMSVRPGSRS